MRFRVIYCIVHGYTTKQVAIRIRTPVNWKLAHCLSLMALDAPDIFLCSYCLAICSPRICTYARKAISKKRSLLYSPYFTKLRKGSAWLKWTIWGCFKNQRVTSRKLYSTVSVWECPPDHTFTMDVNHLFIHFSLSLGYKILEFRDHVLLIFVFLGAEHGKHKCLIEWLNVK